MSVVKRANRAACIDATSLFEVKSSPSKESRAKAEIMKRYLEQSWSQADERKQSREKRYMSLMQSLEDSNLSDEEKQEIICDFSKEENEFMRFSRTKMKPDNFNYIKLIGRGGFADVWLVTNKKTDEINALKIMRKQDIILSDQIENIKTERNILAMAQNPWIVKLFSSFQDENNLYLVLEFIQGGDLMSSLQLYRTFPPSVARFFGGELALALNSVHQLGYIHRDIKPDNILLDISGHIKLTDFGIASKYGKNEKDFQDLLLSLQDNLINTHDGSQILSTADTRRHRKRNSVVGSIDYTAPEVLLGKNPTVKSDWWSFGIILYEMLFGFTPFASASKKETALRIINWKKALRIPANRGIPPHAYTLLKGLLCDEETRFGFEEIIRHPFFAGFNFENPFQTNPPLKPNVSDPLDTSHFETFENVKREDLRGAVALNDLAAFIFKGYSFKAKPPSITLSKFGISA